MAGGAEHRHRLADPAGAGGGLGGALPLAAEQVQHVGGGGGRAEAAAQVDHRRVALAERAVGARGPAGQLDRGRHQVGVQRGQVAAAGHPAQPRRRPVGRLAAQQVVVHLHDHLGAGLEADAVAVAQLGLVAAGRPRRQPAGVGDVGSGPLDAAAAEAGPAGVDGLVVERARRLDLVGLDAEEDHVVHDLGVAGHHLAAGQPHVLVEAGVEQEAAVVVGAVAAGGRGRVLLGHLQAHPLLAAAQRQLLARRQRRELLGDDLGRVDRREHAGRVAVAPVVGAEHGHAGHDPGHGEQAGQGEHDQAAYAGPAGGHAAHPGGHVIGRPASTCRWVWKTDWPAPSPVLSTSR